jgi:hypothetical protein
MVYTTLPYSKIYLSYNAPNNHILLNILLKFWINSTGGLFPLSEMTFRLFALVSSSVVISLMFWFWRRRLGVIAASLTILSFAVSTPFLIYGSALRGYMLSLIFVICGMETAQKFIETGRKKFLLFYLLSALICIAVIPSNIFIFALIAILPLPKSFFLKQSLWDFIRNRWLLALLPLVSFTLFYGPIFNKLYPALKHNNGWLHPTNAVIHLYSAFIITLLPAVILAFTGGFIYTRARSNTKSDNKKRQNRAMSFIKNMNTISLISLCLIFTAPALVISCRNPAPFPRIFFQVWPLWLFIIGSGIKHIVALIRYNTKKLYLISLALSVIAIGWGALIQSAAPELSELFTINFSQDDFFQPYYMKTDFTPMKTVENAVKLANHQNRRVFLSQYADFPSLIFYGKLQKIDDDFWITDYPGKKTLSQTKNKGKYYIIVKDKKDLSLIKKRFKLKILKQLNKNSFQKIYEVKYEN